VKRAVLVFVCLVACKSNGTNGVRWIDIYTGGADDNSPLIIAMHGRGGSPERFAMLFKEAPIKAHIALPQGFQSAGFGWAWFEDWKDIGPAEAKLWPSIVEKAHGKKVIVTGFSQGGMMSFAMAARHPDEIIYALPLAGILGPGLEPQKPGAPVYAIHGTDDKVLDIRYTRPNVQSFVKAGGKAELVELPGVGHDLAPMRKLFFDKLATILQ
jgi:phospholipase/carboxylesterase